MPGPMSRPPGEGRSQGEGAECSHWASIILFVTAHTPISSSRSAFRLVPAPGRRPRPSTPFPSSSHWHHPSDPVMPRCSVTRRVHFNAAHRVHNPKFSDEWNRTTFGACNNPNYHGHNYELELTVTGEIDADTGYVLDLNLLKDLAQEHLVARLD